MAFTASRNPGPESKSLARNAFSSPLRPLSSPLSADVHAGDVPPVVPRRLDLRSGLLRRRHEPLQHRVEGRYSIRRRTGMNE